MATLGAGTWREDKATVTVEDSGAVRVVGRQVLRDDKQRFFNYLLTENYYISGGPTNNGGVIFEWFAKQFGDFGVPFDTEQIMDNLIREASNVRLGSDGLLFLPYLLGERAPLWNANARGSYFGINIKHERQHFIRATIEGILYEIYSIGKILQEHRAINSLSVNGSFATIPFCAQIMADIFNLPVSMASNSNSVGRGAFLLSAIDMGIYSSFEEAADSTTIKETVSPRDGTAYAPYYKIFERLSTKLEAEFEEIAALQQRV
jgi:gluconokinase